MGIRAGLKSLWCCQGFLPAMPRVQTGGFPADVTRLMDVGLMDGERGTCLQLEGEGNMMHVTQRGQESR